MPTITFTLPVAGQDADAGPIATNFNDLQTLLNGGLDGANFVNASLTLGASFALNIGGDTNLYRSAANTLKTDDRFVPEGVTIPANATLTPIITQQGAGFRLLRNELVAGDANAAFAIQGNGTLIWGAGGATAPDTHLYRLDANILQTDDEFRASGDIIANALEAGQVLLGGGGGTPIIYFGNTADTNLYRSAADTLKTDDAFLVGANVALHPDGRLQLVERTDPGAVANTAVIYAKDNGAGKTQLMVQMPSGAPIQIAIQP